MKKFLLPCVIAVFLCSGCSIHTQKEVDAMKEDYQKQYDGYEDDIADLNDQIDELEDEEEAYETQIAELTEENEDLQVEYDALSLENEDLSNQADEMAESVANLSSSNYTATGDETIVEYVVQGDEEYFREAISDDANFDLTVIGLFVLTITYDYMYESQDLDTYFADFDPYITEFYAMDTGDFSYEEQELYDDTMALWLILEDIYYYGESSDDTDNLTQALTYLYYDLENYVTL